MFVLVTSLIIAIILAVFGLVVRQREGSRGSGGAIALSSIVVALVGFGLSGITKVESSKVGIQKVFGRVLSEPLMEGPHWVMPWVDVVELDLQQMVIEIRTDETRPNASIAMTSDEIPLTTLDVGFPVNLNPAIASKLYQAFRENYGQTVLVPSAHGAVREAAAQFTWRQATVEQRDPFRLAMLQEFSKAVQANLELKGFSADEAKTAFIFPGVQLRAVLPPTRILAANAERQAATVDLQRQEVLTQIAMQQALRRTQEGEGINNLFSKLPAGYSPEDVYRIMSAVALKENADALTRAVEDGRIQMMVIPYGSSPALPSSGAPPSTAASSPVAAARAAAPPAAR